MSSTDELTFEERLDLVSKILAQRTSSEEELELLALLRPLAGEDLARILEAVEPARLLQALDDRFWGPKSRKEFLRILPASLPFLNLQTKGDIVKCLAVGKTDLTSEIALKEIFLSESGDKLTELKIDIDCASNGHDLLYLLHYLSLIHI